jgi:pimeloyl-ACP methyl ester carboxylesterase
MQFYYQFPQRTERLILVSSGGLGREVSWPLRVAAAPGVEALLGAATRPRVLGALRRGAEALHARDVGAGVHLAAAHRALSALNTPGARRGFLWTLRSVIDAHGQKVSARDRLYLTAGLPTLVVWGARDHTIPVQHGREAAAEMPEGRFAVIDGAAHFPHLDDPAALAALIAAFVSETEPARIDAAAWERILTSADGAPAANGSGPGRAASASRGV